MDVRELIPLAQRRGGSSAPIGLWLGTFARPLPVLTTDAAWVVLPDVDVNTKWGPCYWEPRLKEVLTNVAEAPEAAHNISIGRIMLPVFGNKALVAFDNQRSLWIVSWWPS